MLARLAAAAGEGEEARDRYRRALELDRGLAQAWFGLAVLDQGQGRLKEAREGYEKALALAPGHRQYLTNLADLELAEGDYKTALGVYDRLLRLHPDLLLARLDAGNTARLVGDLPGARWHHERLLRDLAKPGSLAQGDNAAQWAFDLPAGEVTMDAADSKRAYALLSVSLTRLLAGDPTGSGELRRQAATLPELARARAVLDFDLGRLEATRPEWRDTIEAYRRTGGP